MNYSSNQKKRGVQIVSLLLLAGLLICLIILACVPPVSRDALIHHLQIPKLYLQHGSIYEIPELVFSYYPMNLDLIYMAALYLGNDILPKYIHMFFGCATAYLLYNYLKKRLSITYAYLGALFFLSIPIIIRLSISVYVDLGLIFFTTAALLLLFEWLKNSSQQRLLILAGFSCGLAVGTKYNGLIVLFLLTLFIPVLYIRNSAETKITATAIRSSILFLFCALVIASPWFIRNSIWTANPIYPLYNSFFNPSVEVTKNNIKGVFALRYVLYGENVWQLMLLPIRIFFQGVDNDPRYFDGRLNPFLLFLPFLAFLYKSKQKQIHLEKITLLMFCILYFLFAFNTSTLRIRYLSPIVPFLVILAMYGLQHVEWLINKYVKKQNIALAIWLIPTCLMFSINGKYIYQQFNNFTPLSYISGRISRDEYLIQHWPEYAVIQYANTHLPDSAKILCVFMGWRGYYINNKHFFDHHSSSQWLLAWLKNPNITTNQIRERLLKRKISHLLIRNDLLEQWLRHAPLPQQSRWNSLKKKDLTLITFRHNYTLFQISNDEGTLLPSQHHSAKVKRVK